ncbi:ABC transporter ATP-binding protein [Schlesneria paludicola]|uniref:ABC transporter ATP-binding protein n=1 Tax=Schlesneria paludicola TaxID=360056 RepID=UPI00029A6425|nr:ATP-binding cassette domain-containing protein [Schlesneria paludicola]
MNHFSQGNLTQFTGPPQPSIASTVIETRSLTKAYGTLKAVDGLSLSIEAGRIFGLLGPNGAGKSTLMKMLVTLLPPTSGSATIAGCDLLKHPAQVRRSIGYVPQLLSADAMLSGYENLLIFAKLYDLPKADREARIADALQSADLQNVASHLVSSYSGGMVRRLEIVTAMLHRPKVLFLDEPSVGLDPVARSSVWQQIRELVANYGTTVVLTTHFMDEANALCDRIAIMSIGKIRALGSVAELKAGMNRPDATLDEIFAYYSRSTVESGERIRDIANTRRASARLG